jgi:hypothetical protein
MEKFEQFMRDHRFSCRALGRVVGVTGEAVQQWTKHKTTPTQENLKKIQEIYTRETGSRESVSKFFKKHKKNDVHSRRDVGDRL